MNSSVGSVTGHLSHVKRGSTVAIQQIWDRYFERLIRLARLKLIATPQLKAYDEDVALSAFASFFRAMARDRFPDLRDRTDLWQILIMLTHRKARGLIRREYRSKRGGGRIQFTPDRSEANGSSVSNAFMDVINREPTPQEAVEIAEECQRQLDLLNDQKLRQIALWKLEGFSNEEIAERLGCVLRTVERKLHAIRAIWAKENPT